MKKWLLLLFLGFITLTFSFAQVNKADKEWNETELIFLSSVEDMKPYDKLILLLKDGENELNQKRISLLQQKVKDTSDTVIKIRMYWLEAHVFEDIGKRGIP